MIWEPFFLAVVFGLLVSAAIYFIVLWPRREPSEGGEGGEASQLSGEPDGGGEPRGGSEAALP